MAGLADREQWVENLKLRLRVSYRQDPSGASFGFVSRNTISQPSLYATRAVVGINAALGQPIENPERIRVWIESLRDQEGAYDDKHLKFSRLVQTYWAVKTLRNLGYAPNAPDKTIAFIRSLQDSDGLFHEDTSSANSTLSQKLSSTFFALNILRDLGVDLKRASYLESTQKILAQYLQTQIAALEEGTFPPADAPFVSVVRDLAWIDPLAVDPRFRSVIEHNLTLVHITNDFRSQMLALSFLDAGAQLGLEYPDTQIERLRQSLQATALPQLNQQTAITTEAGIIEPAMTLVLVQLLKRLAVPYPNQTTLQKQLAKYRIREGWIMFTIPKADAGITYHALVIADSIGYTEFDALQVAKYLQKEILKPDASENLRVVPYAVQALALLGQKPDAAALQAIEQSAATRIENAKEAADFQSLVDLALLTRITKNKWSALLQERTRQAIQHLDAQTDLRAAEAIYKVALLQTVSQQEVISPQQLKTNLLALATSDGGFKAVPTAQTGDLVSTYFALDALIMMGDTKGIEPQKIRQFVLSTQDEYGFTFVPRATLQQESFKGTGLENALATYIGFEILEMVQDGIKPGKYGLP